MRVNYHNINKVEIDDELKDWIDSHYLGFTVCFGVPVYDTVKACIIASSVGYHCNRACYLTDNKVSLYLMGNLVPITLNTKFAFPS